MKNYYTDEQRKEIIELRDKKQYDFSQICKIMKLSQRKARSLYTVAKYSKSKPIKRLQ